MPVHTPEPVPLARRSAVIQVLRDPLYSDEWELVPNVVCVGITKRIGPEAWLARFRYRFLDPDLAPDDPSRIEEVYPLTSTGEGIIVPDERVGVRAVRDDGYTEWLFTGFAQVPQADLDHSTEAVTFSAVADTEREWDRPLVGAYIRDGGSEIESLETTANTQTTLPARFNPDGKPNATPADADNRTTFSDGSAISWPSFHGPVPSNAVNGKDLRAWTLEMAASYVVARGITRDDGSLTPWVAFSGIQIPDRLEAVVPTTPGGIINLDNEATFTYEPIELQDVDLTGMPWPDALHRIVEPHGFAFHWILGSDSSDNPEWRFKVVRLDAAPVGTVKTVSLQSAGGTYDPRATNVAAMSLARDTRNIANRIVVDCAPTRWEASFVLAPGFEVAASDATTLDDFKVSSPNFAANRDKYRLFVFDELGAGHWNGSAFVTNPTLLRTLFGRAPEDRHDPFVGRPGRGTLLTLDDAGAPLRATLHVSFDWEGESPNSEPAIYDQTGTWFPVSTGEWRLLDDRLGVYITSADANSVSAPKAPAGKINIVQALVAGGASRPRFMLTTVIDGPDWGIDLGRRAASPTTFTITRHIDGRDRFHKHTISKRSYWGNGLLTDEDEIVRDDTDAATTYGSGIQRSREGATFAGQITIPRLSTAYDLGDKIKSIDGRNLSLRSNSGAEAGETAYYPTVVGVHWEFDGQQATRLELSDHRAEPAPRRGGRLEE